MPHTSWREVEYEVTAITRDGVEIDSEGVGSLDISEVDDEPQSIYIRALCLMLDVRSVEPADDGERWATAVAEHQLGMGCEGATSEGLDHVRQALVGDVQVLAGEPMEFRQDGYSIIASPSG